MARTLFENAEIVDPEDRIPQGARLLVGAGRIQAALAAGDSAPDDAARVDLGGAYLCPGFIDVHVHGSAIFHDAAGLNDALLADGASMTRQGVTSFLATTVTASAERLDAFVTHVASCIEEARFPGALPLGVHLEGPWINAAAAGAQPGGAIGCYDARHDAALLDRVKGVVKLVTLAPEIPGSAELLADLARRDIVAALGHSLADASMVDDAVRRGARHVTHLFNAMGPLHHRQPGLAGSALADDRLTCDLICDGVHVHPQMVAVAARALGQRLLLITDRVDPPDPTAPGPGQAPLHREAGAWRLPGGQLAGSGIGLDDALRNLCDFTGAGLRDAVAACSLRPAQLLSEEARRGSLRPGARADFAVLGSDLRVRQTWIGGERVYSG